MSNYKINRRNFITSAGTIFTLPMLEALFPYSKAWAALTNDPKRYVGFYCPDGTYNDGGYTPVWLIKGTQISSANTCPVLAPFSNLYSKTVAIGNVNNFSFWDAAAKFPGVGGDDHRQAAQSYFTSATSRADQTSFEHFIANKVGKKAIVIRNEARSSADNVAQQDVSYINGVGQEGYTGPDQLASILRSAISPTAAPVVVAQVQNQNKSIIDSSLADFNSLRANLGKNDKIKLDEYLAGLRDLEKSIVTVNVPPAPMPGSGSCVQYTLASNLNGSALNNKDRWLPDLKAYNDMIKIAFACDISRSVTVLLGTETSDRELPSAPVEIREQGVDTLGARSHSISHGSTGQNLFAGNSALSTAETLNYYQKLVTRDRLYMYVVNDLVSKLSSTLDPSGSSIFDNTIIQIGHGVGNGGHLNVYDNSNLEVMLLGGANVLTGGRSVDVSGSKMNDMYFTIANKLGLGVTTYQGSSKIIPI